MKKRIIISESQLRLLIENKEEYLFIDFKDDLVKFIKDLLSNPANAELPSSFQEKGLDRHKVIETLIDNGLLTRKQKVIEVQGSDGKKTSKISTVYSANIDKGLDKIGKCYESFNFGTLTFKENVEDEELLDETPTSLDSEVEECTAAGAVGGADGYQYTVPFTGVSKKDPAYSRNLVRKKLYQPKNKKNDI